MTTRQEILAAVRAADYHGRTARMIAEALSFEVRRRARLWNRLRVDTTTQYVLRLDTV